MFCRNVLLRVFSIVFVICYFELSGQPLPAQISPNQEYLSKATFLVNFTNFIEWPPGAFPNSSTPFLLCVIGDFSFGTTLAELTRGIRVQGHRMDVRWIRKNDNPSVCNMVFVSHSEIQKYSRLIGILRTASILTVGETPEFLDVGGIMSFSLKEGNLQFDVNIDAANRAGLKISSRLLVLARQVISKREDARS